MNHTALHSASIKTSSSSSTAIDVLRELIAAMPVVIFFKAARAALKR